MRRVWGPIPLTASAVVRVAKEVNVALDIEGGLSP
jgi:hypothetical protein